MIVGLPALAMLAAIAVAAFGYGAVALAAARLTLSSRVDRALWPTALGLVIVGSLLTLLGLLHLLSPIIVQAVTAIGWGCAAWAIVRSSRDHRVRAPDATPAEERVSPAIRLPAPPCDSMFSDPPIWLVRTVSAAAIFAVLAALVNALAPPTAGDALCYHLELPKRYLASGQLEYLPYSEETAYPQLAEIWFLWGLAIGGPVAAQGMHWLSGVILIVASYALARPMVGAKWGGIAAGIVALIPAVTNEMTAPLNDVALAACCTLSLVAWNRAAEEGQASLRWHVMAGVFAGAALSIKYTALLFAAMWCAGWIMSLVTQWRTTVAADRFARLRGGFVVIAVGVLLASPWYMRSFVLTGDPIYPYLSPTKAPPVLRDGKRPLGRDVRQWLTAPWEVVMHPERFGGRAYQFGPFFLALLPAALLFRLPRPVVSLALLALVYAVQWCLLRQNLRFLLPIASLLAVIAAATWASWRESGAAPRLVTAILLALLAVPCAIAVRRALPAAAVVTGFESVDTYLARHEPTWPISRWANQHLPPGARILSQDLRAFYFAAPLVRESVYRRHTQYDRAGDEADGDLAPHAVLARLRSAGFTHLLLAEWLEGEHPPEDAKLRAWLSTLAATDTPQIRTCTSIIGRDTSGARRRYTLCEITPVAMARRSAPSPAPSRLKVSWISAGTR